MFHKNGFQFDFTEGEEGSGSKILLKTLPFSKNIQFTADGK